MSSRRFNRRGFTWIELIVVIALIMIVLALLLSAVTNVRVSSRDTYCANKLK
ncbi:MAG: type II secretion system GspH family protein, partial [Planctomycetales bacterium]